VGPGKVGRRREKREGRNKTRWISIIADYSSLSIYLGGRFG
jgi:hypothetical protein